MLSVCSSPTPSRDGLLYILAMALNNMSDFMSDVSGFENFRDNLSKLLKRDFKINPLLKLNDPLSRSFSSSIVKPWKRFPGDAGAFEIKLEETDLKAFVGGAPSYRIPDAVGDPAVVDMIADVTRIMDDPEVACQILSTVEPILLVQTLVHEMFHVLDGGFKQVYFIHVLANLTKTMPKVIPPIVGKTVHSYFVKFEDLDSSVADSLVTWLATHLNNFGFSWPWKNWMSYSSAPQTNFIRRVLRYLSQLASFEEGFVTRLKLPQELHYLAPESTEFVFTYSDLKSVYSDMPSFESEDSTAISNWVKERPDGVGYLVQSLLHVSCSSIMKTLVLLEKYLLFTSL